MTTRYRNSLTERLSSPTRRVHPTNDFVRFRKEWTAKSIPECFNDRFHLGDQDRLALRLPDDDFSYRELDQLSDQVAHALVSLGRPRPEAISLLLDHDALVPAAMLGVLKSGKFYVPLEPSSPLERNRFVLEDSQAELLITNSTNLSLAVQLCGRDCRILNLDEISSQFTGDCSRPTIVPDDLAYVLYTSGSTGKPKGVMHTHHDALHKVMRHTNGRRTCRDDRVAVLFSYCFGPATTNLFHALLNGAAAFPFNIKELGVTRLAQWLVDREITQVHTVPTLFRHFTDALVGNEEFPSLRLIELGGETMFSTDLERFKKHFGSRCILMVGMGTTETGHVFDSGYGKETECGTGFLPVGYPVEDTQSFVLDERRQPVAYGSVGEIAIRGSFLSVGYWRQPELTAKAFLADPDGGPDRMFLTGDLGCMLPDGCVFHLGRKDDRVKIRGYRIEIPEVEFALLRVPGVRDGAVVVQGGPGEATRLVAYFALKAGVTLAGPQLRTFLKAELPDYMVPSAFVLMESLPLLTSGKVNRQALSSRSQPVLSSGRGRVIGREPYLLEAQLSAIWEELLPGREVGLTDDFFDVGGDSLLAVEMALRIEDVCGRTVSLSELGSELTIERIARALTDVDRQNVRFPVRVIQSGGSRTPLFFHNGDNETGGLYCRNLARHLGPDQPFYSLMPHGFFKDPVPETIEAMAADHLRSVREIQPEGPYVLGGFCYGGVVAFEMARQLQHMGHDVEAVLMIDSRARSRSFRSARKAVVRLAAVLRLSPGTESELVRMIKRFLAFREACRGGARQTVYFLGRKMKSFAVQARLRRRFGQNLDRSAAAANAAWNVRTPWWFSHLAMDAYVPEKFSGRLVLFRTTSLIGPDPDDATAGWREVAPEVAVEWCVGNHKTCVTKHIDDLAQRMNRYLTDTAQGSTAGAAWTGLREG